MISLLCFQDGLDLQCISAVIFIYFASLSGAIAFGGLMGTKTEDDVGIPETLLGKRHHRYV
jgi:solute carrier family 4 anion exchanger 2